jgi:transcription initiation factor TFIID TATA-box-binding protein
MGIFLSIHASVLFAPVKFKSGRQGYTPLGFYGLPEATDMEIVSTMGSGSLGRELDLEVLVSSLQNHLNSSLDANFTSNGMATVRLEEDGPAYTLFRTGSFQIRGAKTEDRLNKAANRFREVLSDVGVEVPDYEFKHVTSVFMEDLGREVNLEALTIALGMEDTEYEPEQFPGLIYRPPGHEVTLLVFASGKIIVGGTTDRNEAKSAVQQLEDELSVLDSS